MYFMLISDCVIIIIRTESILNSSERSALKSEYIFNAIWLTSARELQITQTFDVISISFPCFMYTAIYELFQHCKSDKLFLVRHFNSQKAVYTLLISDMRAQVVFAYLMLCYCSNCDVTIRTLRPYMKDHFSMKIK